MSIPKEKLSEFTERVLTILRQGGMMGIERVELYGKRVALLTPPVPDEVGKVVSCYNYFEDDGWDSICYNTKTGQFKSRDVGCLQFREVVCAVYVLYGFYAAGVAYCDGEPFDKSPYIGWLNYLFDEDFSDRQADSNTPVEKSLLRCFSAAKALSVMTNFPFGSPSAMYAFPRRRRSGSRNFGKNLRPFVPAPAGRWEARLSWRR